MKTITVSNGDIQLNNGKLAFSYGANKLAQDIALWLKEPLGTGWTTPNFGSLLPGMIGKAQTSNIVSSIENEVIRVLQLYQGQQVIMLQQAQNAAQLSYWNRNEIIQSIVSVSASVSPTNPTAINVAIILQTLTGSLVNLLASVNNNGVVIQNG